MSKLNRQMYLRQLSRLLLRYNRAERESILADYQEFFEAGAAKGRSDEEICAELGSPRAVAAMLLHEFPPAFSLKSLKVRPALCGVLCLLLAWAAAHLGQLSPGLLMAGLPLVAVLLRLAVGAPPCPSDIPRGRLWAAHLACCGLALGLWLVFTGWMPQWLNHPPFGLPLARLGWFASTILFLFAAGAVALIGLGLRFYKSSLIAFTVVCHALGVLGMALHLGNLLHNLDHPTSFVSACLPGLVLYLEGLVLAVAFWLWQTRKGGDAVGPTAEKRGA